MTEEQNSELSENTEQMETGQEPSEASAENMDDRDALKRSLEEANNKYIRLYADFENFKKITARNKEELLKYANEDLLSDILTVIDHLELALQHSTADSSDSLAEGVELTLKELKNVLEKHGLKTIDALGKPFDPAVHHAISQIESEKEQENTVIKEFRKGYILRDRVLRAAMVGVAIKQSPADKSEEDDSQGTLNNSKKTGNN